MKREWSRPIPPFARLSYSFIIWDVWEMSMYRVPKKQLPKMTTCIGRISSIFELRELPTTVVQVLELRCTHPKYPDSYKLAILWTQTLQDTGYQPFHWGSLYPGEWVELEKCSLRKGRKQRATRKRLRFGEVEKDAKSLGICGSFWLLRRVMFS